MPPSLITISQMAEVRRLAQLAQAHNYLHLDFIKVLYAHENLQKCNVLVIQ